MNYRIRFASGVEFPQPEQATPPVSPMPSGRAWRRIDIVGTVEEAKAVFVNDAKYAQVWDSITTEVDEVGNEVETIVEESRDLSEWCIAGEIIDRRDGTVCVLMGKPTEIEAMVAREAEYIENLRALGVEV